MKLPTTLPGSFRKTEEFSAHLPKSRHRRLNLLSFGIMLLFFIAGWKWKGLGDLTAYLKMSFTTYCLYLLGLFVLMTLCAAGLELLKALFLKLFSGQKVFFARTKLLFVVGCDGYFPRGLWLLVALLPVLLLGGGLFALCLFAPAGLFWISFLGCASVFSQSVGQFYCLLKALGQPRGAYYCDLGVVLQVYREEL